jgi:hypothetical protein
VLGLFSGISYVCKVMRDILLTPKTMNTDRVHRFFQLQEMINFQIDLTGSANLEAVDELEELANSLNDEEVDYIFENA